MALDVGKVWEKLNEDPEFAAMPDGFKQATKPTVDALPEILGELADKPAGLATIAQTKIAYLKYSTANGNIRASIESLPDELLPMDKQVMVKMVESALTEIIMGLEEMADPATITEMLEAMGTTESAVMMDPDFGLDSDTQISYLTGELTIGKLLEIQPSIILKPQA